MINALCGLEIVIGKLTYGKFDTWQEKEQEAVNEYLFALWNYLLSQYPISTILIDEFIERITDVTGDLEKYLFAWQHHFAVNSLIHLSKFICEQVYLNTFPMQIIDLSPGNTATFFNWLMQEEITTKLEQSFFQNIDKDYADCMAMAIDILKSAKEQQKII